MYTTKLSCRIQMLRLRLFYVVAAFVFMWLTQRSTRQWWSHSFSATLGQMWGRGSLSQLALFLVRPWCGYCFWIGLRFVAAIWMWTSWHYFIVVGALV
jgi:hypothetical protein